MSDPLATLSTLLMPVFAGLNGGEPADPTVRPSDRADAQINGALSLAKRVGSNPRDLAQQIVDSGVLVDVASEFEVAGPGFINVTFADAFLEAQLAEVVADDRLGVARAVVAKRVVIDYSAPNVAKEMHVGHLRTTVIGDSLVRMMEFLGHTVIKENHVGDWGTPFGMLIEHLVDLGEDTSAGGLDQGELDVFYKEARTKFDGSDEFKDRARARVVQLQDGTDPETTRLWELLVAQSTTHFNELYDKLDILLTDEDLAGESMYQPMMLDTIGKLDDAGLVKVDDGAKVVFPPGFENREGHPLPLIIQARTGGFNYATSDLACVYDRIHRLDADLMLYVIGTPQSQHLQMVFEVARMAGWLKEPTEAIHVNFGNVLGNDRKMLKSRSGDPLKFVALLDEAVERAQASIAEKNPDLAASDATIAKTVGIGAVKYFELSADRIKDYVFDWDRMLAFEGNTGPYLQYAHARICSVFRRAAIERSTVRDAPIVFGHVAEKALAMRIMGYPSAIENTLDSYSPHKLCTYVYELASDFSSFYQECPILKSDEPMRTSRLALADLAARVLEHSLGLLGIIAPQEM
ncbi:arginine--tRNA ligase [uncultured Ilumatobacter sp.]|uniref:arginine--tRNA ligase n=1 Tax=uncultured Ilumatobacter sp. TaxID=879968 RepID=UPI00374FCB49